MALIAPSPLVEMFIGWFSRKCMFFFISSLFVIAKRGRKVPISKIWKVFFFHSSSWWAIEISANFQNSKSMIWLSSYGFWDKKGQKEPKKINYENVYFFLFKVLLTFKKKLYSFYPAGWGNIFIRQLIHTFTSSKDSNCIVL